MKYLFFALILIVFHLYLLSRLQFTAWPEMFSYPYLLSNGFDLYKDIALPYQPLLTVLLSLIYKISGYNLITLKIITWAIIVGSDLLIFIISHKLIKEKFLSLVPPALYVFVQPLTDGNMLWFDLATVPLLLSGSLLFLKFEGYKKYFWLGFFLSLAFLTKQQIGIAYFLLIIALLFKKRFKETLYILIGSLIPACLIFLYILFSGTTKDYIFWTIEVPLYWYPKFPGYINFPSMQEIIIIALLILPGFFAILNNLKKLDLRFMIIFLMFLGAFFSAFPRFNFFRFQPALALYIILIIFLITKLKAKQIIFYSMPVILSILLLFKINSHQFNQTTRFFSEEDRELSSEISDMTGPTDNIYILGGSSTLYVLSNRLPSKPWVDNYVWYLEIEGIQDKVIDGFKKNPPAVIFRKIPNSGNWYDLGTYQPKKIVLFIEQNYQKMAKIKDIEVWTKK